MLFFITLEAGGTKVVKCAQTECLLCSHAMCTVDTCWEKSSNSSSHVRRNVLSHHDMFLHAFGKDVLQDSLLVFAVPNISFLLLTIICNHRNQLFFFVEQNANVSHIIPG